MSSTDGIANAAALSGAAADWFERGSATAQRVRVTRAGAALRIQWPEGRCRLVDVSSGSWLTDAIAPRPVLAVGGGQLVLDGRDAVLVLGLPTPSPDAISRLVGSWAGAGAAVVGIVAMVGLLLALIVPSLGRLAAALTPLHVEARLGMEVLRALDRSALKPSSMDPESQERIRARFTHLSVAAELTGVQLHFRGGGTMGANALALPGRHVIVTDELVTLLGESSKLDAVLAHELGHVAEQHGLRMLYQRGGVALVISTALGNAEQVIKVLREGSIAVLAAAYSREAEREADAFAHALLPKVGLSAASLGDALEALQRAAGVSGERPAYFGTHPPSPERVEAARSAR